MALGEEDGETSAAAPPRAAASAWMASVSAAAIAAALVWTLAPRRPSVLVIEASSPVESAVATPVRGPAEASSATGAVPVKGTVSARGGTRNVVLPAYRTLPDDDPPAPPARGFKTDPY